MFQMLPFQLAMHVSVTFAWLLTHILAASDHASISMAFRAMRMHVNT
jgi:hypothetical protein